MHDDDPTELYALRDGDLKIVEERGRVELYDVVDDPGEETDLADSRPEDAARLGAALRALIASIDSAADDGT